MDWVKVSERLPTEAETLNWRVPVLDKDGFLGYALLVDNDNQKPWLMSEFDVEYWLPISAPKK